MGPKLVVLITIIAVASMLAACTPAAPTAAPGQAPAAGGQPAAAPAAKGCPKVGGTLRIGLRAEVASLDPHWNSLGGDADVTFNVYDGLVRLAPDFSAQPDLAASWESPDPKTYIFHLRQGVKFHDGTPFNAEAAKYNIDRILGLTDWTLKEKPNIQKEFNAAIAAAKVVDDSTLRLEMKAASPWLLAILGDYTEFMASPTAMKKLNFDMTRNPVGTGPFTFVEKVDDDHITIKRNPDYWEKDENGCQLPFLDEVFYKILPDETVRLTNVKAGTMGFMTQVPPKDVESLRKDKSLTYMEGPSIAYVTLRLNASKPPLDDINCRQALMYSVDRDALVKTVWFNVGGVSRGPVSPAFGWLYNPQGFAYGLDPAKAQEALAKCPTKPLKFEHLTRNQPQFVQLAEAIQAQWKKVGIESVIQSGDNAAQQSDMRAGNFVMLTGRDSGRTDPGVTLSDGYGCDEKGQPGRGNYQKYCDKKLDELFGKAQSEMDQAKRKQLLQESADYANQLALRGFLIDDVENALLRPEFDGYVMYGHGKQILRTVHLAK